MNGVSLLRVYYLVYVQHLPPCILYLPYYSLYFIAGFYTLSHFRRCSQCIVCVEGVFDIAGL